MKYNPNIHHRKSIRLRGYDYSQAGLYFITICTQNRLCLFGEIVDGKMILNDAGRIANECWLNIPEHFPNVILHEHIIMPNHVHGIIELVGANDHTPEFVGANNHSAETIGANNHSPDTIGANNHSPPRSPSKTIGSVVRGFKIGVTKWFRSNGNMGKIWQRNYWEHIIRNEQSFQQISKYIINNPNNWEKDKLKGK